MFIDVFVKQQRLSADNEASYNGILQIVSHGVVSFYRDILWDHGPGNAS